MRQPSSVNEITIGVAQIPVRSGDVKANIETHLAAIASAASQNVSYLVFPELSLTGYEPTLAAQLSFNDDDPRLEPLFEAASRHRMHIGVGLPLSSIDQPLVGLMILSPDGNSECYAKMHLHPGEDAHFSSGTAYHCFEIAGVKIANAICADTNHRHHAEQYRALGAQCYLAGVLITESGYAADSAKLMEYSRDLNLLVAMANHNSLTGGWQPVGKSAIWYQGQCLIRAGESESILLIARRRESGWSATQITLPV